MSKAQKSIVGGMTVLSVVGIISKIIGALHRIPLAWLIGDQGMGTYQLVFPTYNMLLAISSAGLPVAISRMVSFSLAKDDPKNAKRIFRVALYLLSALGFIAMVLMIAMSPWLAKRSGDLATQPGFAAIAPALLLVCTMSAFRGFMQGQQNMVPTAMSQMIEQCAKVLIALPLAYFGMKVSIAYAAAGVLLGTSIAEALALLYMFLTYRRNKGEYAELPQAEGIPLYSTKSIMTRLMSLSIPITVGACIVPMSAFIDSGLLLNRLVDAGIERGTALGLYGRYSGYVLTLINVPSALAAAIAMSLVPSISRCIAQGDGVGMRKQSALGLRLSFVVGLPCTVAMCVLSTRLLSLMFHFSSPETLEGTGKMLSLSAITIVLFTVVQSTSGILQGLRKQRIPMYTLLVGVIVKVYLNYTLIAMPQINIYGASIASITCYTLSMVPNLYYVHKYTGLKRDIVNIFLRPALASALMGVMVFLLGKWLPSGRLWTILIVMLGIGGYVFFSLVTGAVQRSDIAPFLRKFHRKHSKSENGEQNP
ncbi:MAG: polysaccharide biosynthesis protein [Eubacteriales bacterium]|nr:polysaccharide biosynthesis protein [Eubacteriales bacterium]